MNKGLEFSTGQVWEIKWRIETSRLELQPVREYDAFDAGIEIDD